MYKESVKYQNIKVAYKLQYNTLQELAASNLEYFSEVQAEEIKRIALQKELNKAIVALRKKKSNWILPTTLGVVGGLVGGLLLSN